MRHFWCFMKFSRGGRQPYCLIWDIQNCPIRNRKSFRHRFENNITDNGNYNVVVKICFSNYKIWINLIKEVEDNVNLLSWHLKQTKMTLPLNYDVIRILRNSEVKLEHIFVNTTGFLFLFGISTIFPLVVSV